MNSKNCELKKTDNISVRDTKGHFLVEVSTGKTTEIPAIPCRRCGVDYYVKVTKGGYIKTIQLTNKV